jgi:ABC-type proline/glycine betaine transport system ATPase subunit
MAVASRGDIIFGLCNDTIIVTKDYDTIMENAVKEYKAKYHHEFFQIFIDDDWDEKHSYCSWIILTKPCIQVFNGIAPEEISSQGADQFVASLFHSTDIKSIIDLRDQIKTKQISVQKGNYDSDFVQDERPVSDHNRPEWPFYSDLLYRKQHYYHRLNNNILQSVFRNRNYEKD